MKEMGWLDRGDDLVKPNTRFFYQEPKMRQNRAMHAVIRVNDTTRLSRRIELIRLGTLLFGSVRRIWRMPSR